MDYVKFISLKLVRIILSCLRKGAGIDKDRSSSRQGELTPRIRGRVYNEKLIRRDNLRR